MTFTLIDNALEQLQDRLDVFRRFGLFDPTEARRLCAEVFPEWIKPRGGGIRYRKRKHGIEACYLAVIGSLLTGNTSLEMEATVGMPASLIDIEFLRWMTILNEHLDAELQLMDDDEKQQCRGAATCHEGVLYMFDGVDFPIQVGKQKYLFRTYKENVRKRTAIRALMLSDVDGYWRGVECEPAGMYNDQGIVNKSMWNREGVLTEGDDEFVLGDLGFSTTEHINVLQPANARELLERPDLKYLNDALNGDRSQLERNFGVFQNTYRIFDQPWRRHPQLFPITLQVCMKLQNRLWRQPDRMVPNMMRRFSLHCREDIRTALYEMY